MTIAAGVLLTLAAGVLARALLIEAYVRFVLPVLMSQSLRQP